MKVLYLFNGIKRHVSKEAIASGDAHDGTWFGMLRLKRYGIDAEFLELESFISESLAKALRKSVLTMHYAHIPLLPRFGRYDVVFTSTGYGAMFIRAVTRSLGFKGPKWVVLDFNLSGTLAISSGGTGKPKTFREKLFNYSLSKVDGIVTISEAEKNILENIFPHLKGNIIFLHEGVDTEFFKPLPEIPEENYILSVGKDPGRDFKTLIEAAKDLDVKVVIATKPERLAELAPLPANVEIRTFTAKEMLQAYAKAKLVVVPLNPKGEGDSMGTLSVEEAMAMGKPVIATRSESMRSYIEDGVTGVTVPKKDVAEMKAQITKLLSDQSLRATLGRNARDFTVKNCSADRFAESLADFLTKVAKR